jgi:myo-inositol-1(or 4)-monophosphatase
LQLTALHRCAISSEIAAQETMAQTETVGLAEGEGLAQRQSFLEEIIRAAGGLALEGFAKGRQRFTLKGPQDFLTESDGRVEASIREAVKKRFPDDFFLGEEAGGTLGNDIWVVDPIDGTANFARGIPHYCVSIAFVRGNEIELGAIYNPSLDELYSSRRGRGARLNGMAIHVADTTDFNAATVELGWSKRKTNGDYLAGFSALLSLGVNVRRAASGALGLAYVAAGRTDAYAELHMNPWDCLAGLLLVKEAGGVVGPYLAADGLEKGGPVIASTPAIAKKLSRAVGIYLP